MDKKEVQPTTEKSEQELMQDFFKEYQRLCDKRGFQIVVLPAFKSMTDTGTFNVILQTSIGKIAKD